MKKLWNKLKRWWRKMFGLDVFDGKGNITTKVGEVTSVDPKADVIQNNVTVPIGFKSRSFVFSGVTEYGLYADHLTNFPKVVVTSNSISIYPKTDLVIYKGVF